MNPAELSAADLEAFAALAERVVSALAHAPAVLTSPIFLARFGEEAVRVALSGLQDDEARRTQIQVSLHVLVQEFSQ